MPRLQAHFVTLCQQVLALAVVLAVLAPASGVIPLELRGPGASGVLSSASGAALAADEARGPRVVPLGGGVEIRATRPTSVGLSVASGTESGDRVVLRRIDGPIGRLVLVAGVRGRVLGEGSWRVESAVPSAGAVLVLRDLAAPAGS